MIIMKKLTSLLIGCSLALAGAALAQQPVEQQSPSKGKRAPEKAHATQAQPKPNTSKPQAPPATHQGAAQQHGTTQQHGATHDAGAMKQHGATHEQGAAHEHAASNEPGAGKSAKTSEHQESATVPKTNDSGESADTSTPTARQQRVEQRRKGMKGQAAAPKTSTNAAGAAAGAAPSVPAAGQQTTRAKGTGAAKKPDPQKVQQIKTQHANFRAQ